MPSLLCRHSHNDPNKNAPHIMYRLTYLAVHVQFIVLNPKGLCYQFLTPPEIIVFTEAQTFLQWSSFETTIIMKLQVSAIGCR